MQTAIPRSARFDDEAPGLVAILNNRADFERVGDEHWYRIPTRSAPVYLGTSRWVGFYLTSAFGPEKWSVQYWARIEGITRAERATLLPAEADHPRARDQYYRLGLGPLQARSEPIFSRRRRRLVFIPSVWHKFVTALELNDLHHGSPLEDRLWAAFKQEGIDAERQWFEGKPGKLYCLDFAIFCPERNIDVECDGDSWHSNPLQAALDNVRNNFLEQRGWHVLRFSSVQLNQRLHDCLQDVKTTINRCGGLLPDFRLADRPATNLNPSAKVAPPRAALPDLSASLALLLSLPQQRERRQVLEKLYNEYGKDALARALSGKLPELSVAARERAVWCLGELGPNPAAVEGLAACLAVEPSPNVRRLAYSACSKTGARTLEAVILERLDEEENQVLQYALKALGRCGSSAATVSLQRILGRPQIDYVTKASQEAFFRCSRRK